MTLEDKVAVITGGARGIGRAIAKRFLDDGASVVIADIDEDEGVTAAEELADSGPIRFVHSDVGDRLGVRNVIAAAVDSFNAVDILVNNAGILHKADFLELEEEEFDRVIRVNLKGAFLTGQAAARRMVKQIGEGRAPGSIINLASINAIFAIADQVPYSVSKGGLASLTKVMALSLAPYDIRVNAIGPGSIMTDMLATIEEDPEARARILSRTPLGRIGEASEIAGIAAFLASDDASYITGQTIYADGGRLALNYTVAPRDN